MKVATALPSEATSMTFESVVVGLAGFPRFINVNVKVTRGVFDAVFARMAVEGIRPVFSVTDKPVRTIWNRADATSLVARGWLGNETGFKEGPVKESPFFQRQPERVAKQTINEAIMINGKNLFI
ncbi:MAG: hypothetical protein WA705_00075 [Candidatus Ozemobacteraceae bacterium]